MLLRRYEGEWPHSLIGSAVGGTGQIDLKVVKEIDDIHYIRLWTHYEDSASVLAGGMPLASPRCRRIRGERA